MKTKILILFAVMFLLQIYAVSALTVSSVSTNPDEVQPGEQLTLSLTIENNLNDDVEDVAVTINATGSAAIPFAPYQSSNEERIGDISEGDKEKVSFDLISNADIKSGTYTIPVTITYKLNGTAETDSSLVSVIINAKPNMEISSEGSALIKGTSGKIKLKIVNSGLGESKFLNLQISPVKGISFTSSEKIYLGNIDSNDFDNADFEVFVSADSPSSISLPVEITYSDSRNNQITENKIVTIKTYTQKEAESLGLISGNNNFLVFVGIALLLGSYIVFRKVKKRNKNKLSNSK